MPLRSVNKQQTAVNKQLKTVNKQLKSITWQSPGDIKYRCGFTAKWVLKILIYLLFVHLKHSSF
jgi:hypothetical protein